MLYNRILCATALASCDLHICLCILTYQVLLLLPPKIHHKIIPMLTTD